MCMSKYPVGLDIHTLLFVVYAVVKMDFGGPELVPWLVKAFSQVAYAISTQYHIDI